MTINQSTIAALRTSPTFNDEELKESLRLDGWWPDKPAIKDENGLVLEGNRRLKFAHELGIPPVIQVITFGSDDAADDRRIRRAYASNNSSGTTAEDRKAFAIALFKQENWTQDRIGKVLGVTQQMVSRYLAGIYNSVVNSGQAKTSTNPKGAGRPKKAAVAAKKAATTAALAAAVAAPATAAPQQPVETKRPRHKYDEDVEKEAAYLILDGGKSIEEVKQIFGVSEQVVIRATEYMRGYRAARADPEVRLEDISSIPQRERAYRAIMKEMEKFVERHRYDAAKEAQAILNAGREQLKADLQRAAAVVKARNGIWTKAEFNAVLKCVHPDKRKSINEDDMNTAVRVLTQHRMVLLKEKDEPTPDMGAFATEAQMRAAREAVRKRNSDRAKAAHAAKKAGNSGAVDTQ